MAEYYITEHNNDKCINDNDKYIENNHNKLSLNVS